MTGYYQDGTWIPTNGDARNSKRVKDGNNVSGTRIRINRGTP